MAMDSSLTFTFNLFFTLLLICSASSRNFAAGFKHIISFGDSIADTGNALYFYKPDKLPNSARSPYGNTYFGRPTGRCSDGRLVVDFIAEELGLPLVTAYHVQKNQKERSSSFVPGVNMAVAGATALEDSFFENKGIQLPLSNVSLGAQMSWLREYLSTICSESSYCTEILANSVVLVGEIGGNDYNNAFLQGRSEAEVRSFVPEVVKSIGEAINELIGLGAETLVVPGAFPLGCSPAYLTFLRSSDENYYDKESGCINWLNRFSEYHNDHLLLELERARKLHPETTIIYADYYTAGIDLCRSPQELGFSGGALKACCGGEGPYNFNKSVQCGDPESTFCDDPSTYVNWDGIHLTEAAYKWLARGLMHGPYTTPPLSNILCDSKGAHLWTSL